MYDFKQLSPADFEDLTRDLLQQHWHVLLEAFKTGRDQGIDLRYSVVPEKAIIVQCKHFAGSTIAKLIRELRSKELPKVKLLHPARYVLVTSLPLNPADKDKIRAALHPYILSTQDVLGSMDMNNLLNQYPIIETQHFKLWMSSTAVLQRVLHNAEHVQTEFDVDRVRRAIPLYVQTSNYTRAMKILDEHKFIIISGVPGIGKTTLANMLLFAHLESAFQPIVIKTEVREGKKQFNKEIPQIFYYDDFLGETFLGNRFDFLGKKEDSEILDFAELIARSKHAKLILTAREHILRHAFHISEHFKRQHKALIDHQCILELNDYTILDRGRILYNHIYFSDLPVAHKRQLLKGGFYLTILKHRNFNPRLVEWLTRFTNVRQLPLNGYRKEVLRVLENPEQLWRIAFEQQISEAARTLLLALYSLGGEAQLDQLEEAWKKLHERRSIKYNWKRAAEDWRRSLQDLEGGFLVFQQRRAKFVNPSVKDFLDTTLINDPEHLDDLLTAACRFEQVVNIWSLAQSEKGSLLRAQVKQAPTGLVEAISLNLKQPHEQRIDFGRGAYGTRHRDAKPEIRLLTIISIADHTQSVAALQIAQEYSHTLQEYWRTSVPDFDAGAGILRSLDTAHWKRLATLSLHQHLKEQLLNEIASRPRSGGISTLVDYAVGEASRWSDEDQRALARSFDVYLDRVFSTELADAETEQELQELEARLDSISNYCSVDVSFHRDQIGERISGLRSDDEDNNPLPRQWEGADRPITMQEQEAEVRRLFDGLPYS